MNDTTVWCQNGSLPKANLLVTEPQRERLPKRKNNAYIKRWVLKDSYITGSAVNLAAKVRGSIREGAVAVGD